MKIEYIKVKIENLVKNFSDSEDEGTWAFDYKLNIRPAYQREFIYQAKQQLAVIDTIFKGYPLNSIYWVKNKNDTFEVLDGQQRIMSICLYSQNEFSYNEQIFQGLPDDLKKKFLNYELQIYVCDGEESEKLDWFETINIANVPLTKQELRNAIYTGKWLTECKKVFSKEKNNYILENAKKYLSGIANRQDFLETALLWMIDKNRIENNPKVKQLTDNEKKDKELREYMAKNQHMDNCRKEKLYFSQVIEWVKNTFQDNPIMKQIEWGYLFNRFKEKSLKKDYQEEINKLLDDEEVQNKKGIYWYVFDKNESHLNLRQFKKEHKITVYKKNDGICKACQKEGREKIKYDYQEMEGDHIVPWSQGGKTEINNLQMLCIEHNRRKSNK